MSKNKHMAAGFCKWCGQQRTIEINENEYDQQELDEMATWECDCQMARAERSKKERLQMIEDYIAEEFQDERATERNVVWEAVMAVWTKAVSQVQITDSKYQYKVYFDKEGMLNITRLFKETREVAY